MAVSIELIKKLRAMSGAGLSDCKNALAETDGNIEAAMEIIRAKGKAIAAKRSDREASNGCVLVKVEGNFAAMIALKCETDFVAANQDTVDLTQQILDAAIAAKAKDLETVKGLKLADGTLVQDAVTARSGVTGEKTELDGYQFIEGENIYGYNHQNKNILCTLVQLNGDNEELGHGVCMQVAAMSPVAISEKDVPAEVIQNEEKVAAEKTREEQAQKAVEAALKKAGFNLYICENDEHLQEGVNKGEITEAQVEEVRKIKKEVAEQKLASLPAQLIENIVKGRMSKFFKENCLLNQDYILPVGDKTMSVSDYLKQGGKELTVVAFKRFTLRDE